MAWPESWDRYEISLRYECPCGHAFAVERSAAVSTFPHLRRAEDDGADRRRFRPDKASWAYFALYEDGLWVEESGAEGRLLPPDAPLPDFHSLEATCPACGRGLPPARCPECDGPVDLTPYDRNVGAEDNFEWDDVSYDSLCHAGHCRFLLRQQYYHKGN